MTQEVSDRDHTAKLLPFWVNGTLTAAEAIEVEATMAFDADLRAEAAALKKLRKAMQASEPAFSPGEMGLKRLQRAITQETRQNTGWYRSRTATALVAALALIGIYLVLPPVTEKPDVYRQASGQNTANLLTVSFRSDATEGALADLLMRHELVIVDGPSALRLYRLEVGKDQDPFAVALALRRETSLIESVEVSQ